MRLTPRGHAIGLASDERYRLMLSKREQRDAFIRFVRELPVKESEINPYHESIGDTPIRQTVRLYELLLRPALTVAALRAVLPSLDSYILREIEEERREEILEAAEILIKYSGYIDRERMIAEKLHRLEDVKLRGRMDYSTVKSISTEARQKLARIDPETVGQASRIPGISPNDITVLLLLLGR